MKDGLVVAAPMGGWCAPLDDSPDAVFRERTLGDGVSIDPTDSDVLAPFDGVVLSLPETRHAVSLRADNGAEVLIHIGIDTVNLAGDGFSAHVKTGDRVETGQRLLSFDMDSVLKGAASLRTPVVLLRSSAHVIKPLDCAGPIRTGDPIFEIATVAEFEPETDRRRALHQGLSTTVVVGLAHGIHARPAARLIESIKPFDAELECLTGKNKSANARSAVGLMALGVAYSDRLTVSATGPDAELAMTAFVAALEPMEDRPGEVNEEELPDAGQDLPPAPGAIVHGQSASSGLGLGSTQLIRSWRTEESKASGTADDEQALFAKAIAEVREYLEKLAASRSGAAREIALAHRALLDDPTITEDTASHIRQGKSATNAWQLIIGQLSTSLRQVDDRRIRERVDDLQDVGQRVERVLAGLDPGESLAVSEDTIVVAQTLLPSQLLELDSTHVAGICTAAGGTTSHVAILAASMGIPMVVAAGSSVLALDDGTRIGVDADRGELHILADDEAAGRFRDRVRNDEIRRRREAATAKEPCVTGDGVRIHVNANIASARDAQLAVQGGADGCGLLRTEFVFMDRSEPPGLQEQRQVYQEISDSLGDRTLVVRTLDAGGDKPIPYVNQDVEENPALGVRGIRLSLRNRAVLDTQLDALLQVRHSSPLKLMIPMVTSMYEVEAVRETIDGIRQRANRESEFQLGVMIETPAAAIIADKLAEIVDFFSIGTNDLTQYTLAMDRGEPLLAERLDTLHPSVLKLIGNTVDAACEAGKPVAVCGGAAGDVLAAPVLIGLGVRELSMVPSLIARQKARLRSLTVADCVELANQSLRLSSACDVRELAREFVGARSGD